MGTKNRSDRSNTCPEILSLESTSASQPSGIVLLEFGTTDVRGHLKIMDGMGWIYCYNASWYQIEGINLIGRYLGRIWRPSIRRRIWLIVRLRILSLDDDQVEREASDRKGYRMITVQGLDQTAWSSIMRHEYSRRRGGVRERDLLRLDMLKIAFVRSC